MGIFKLLFDTNSLLQSLEVLACGPLGLLDFVLRSGRVTYADVPMMHVSMINVSMMHVTTVHVSVMHVSVMHVSKMYVSRMHISTMHILSMHIYIYPYDP